MAKLNIRIHEGKEDIKSFNPKTVTIGNQVWMQENLAVNDGGEGIIRNPDNGQYYYTWDAAMRIAQSIPGWHLPTVEEWNSAVEACGAEVTHNRWMEDPRMRDYTSAESLYSQLNIQLEGAYYSRLRAVGVEASFWSGTDFNSFGAFSTYFDSDAVVKFDTDNKKSRFSVRLVKD